MPMAPPSSSHPPASIRAMACPCPLLQRHGPSRDNPLWAGATLHRHSIINFRTASGEQWRGCGLPCPRAALTFHRLWQRVQSPGLLNGQPVCPMAKQWGAHRDPSIGSPMAVGGFQHFCSLKVSCRVILESLLIDTMPQDHGSICRRCCTGSPNCQTSYHVHYSLVAAFGGGCLGCA